MENLVNLIEKLLNKQPTFVSSYKTFVRYSTNKNYYYDLEFYQSVEDKYFVHLGITRTDGVPSTEYETIELTEKQYMESKWKLEEWQKVLHENAINQFSEFVESISTTDPYNELLGDES